MSCLFVEQLTVIDCAYLDAARGLVGESWIVDIELEGELDPQSMVLDFGDVKKQLKRAIDHSVDHSLLVPLRAAGLGLQRGADYIELAFSGPAAGAIQHRSPPQALSLLDTDVITAESLAIHLQPILAAVVPANVSAVRINLRNEVISGAYYHYTHGLKKHNGQCQRIAHGHRSRLEIRVDGVRNSALEVQQAARWRDIYLGTRADQVSHRDGRRRLEYTAAEGRFEIELPDVFCELLDTDTTVECIAEHLAQQVSAVLPRTAVDVRAYEGVMKGAIARCRPTARD